MRRIALKRAESIRKKVYKYLREKILKGELKQGERIYEGRIAKEIGVSRTPVREALHALEHEGLLVSRSRVGYTVKILSKEEVYEICEIRKVIEGLAILWAMKKNREKLIRELRKNIELSEKRLNDGDVRSFIDLDARFHEAIAKISGSERILELALTLRRHMLMYRIESIYARENVERAIEGHKKILMALEEGSEDQIKKALMEHIDTSREDILKYAF
ncbi:MAG: GntR family transcriptional regulator [Desulfobacterota bacterium]|nr:GntR family transcriptional regulator [Thermodesulfobacteriota bacterium]